MKIRVARLAGILIATLLAVSACGGSSGGGLSAPPPPPPPPPPVGGITRTGAAIAVGPITAFGSVVVNGITYDTATADFIVDGQPGIQSDLKVGDMVVLQGTIDDDNTNAVAETVEFEDNVEGPVSSVGVNTIVVLGQTVRTANAIIDNSCPSDLLTAAAVEVSGQVMADGSIDATRIECRALLGEMEVTGTVSSLGANTFMINNLVVDFTTVPAVLADFATGSIASGDPVEAKGISLGATGELIATRVEFKGARFADNEGDHIEIEGFISGFISDEEFNIGRTPVTTIPGTTIYVGGSAADLGDNLKVEVEGEFDSLGVLVATKLEIKPANSIRLTAQVDSTNGDSFVMLGITVNTAQGYTRFDDKTGVVDDSFNVTDISTSDYVEIRGQEFPAGSGEILATIVERDDLRAEAIVQGFIDANGVNRPTITVLGVTVEATDGVTIYRNNDESLIADPDEFWGRLSDGSLIKAKGLESSSTTVTAEEIEIQVE